MTQLELLAWTYDYALNWNFPGLPYWVGTFSDVSTRRVHYQL